MELDKFSEEALNNIARRDQAAKSKQDVSWITPGHVEGKPVWKAQNIEFDVAVTATSGAQAGIKVLDFGAADAEHRKENVQQIKFAVPVYFEDIGGPE